MRKHVTRRDESTPDTKNDRRERTSNDSSASPPSPFHDTSTTVDLIMRRLESYSERKDELLATTAGRASATRTPHGFIQRANAMVTAGVEYQLIEATDIGILDNTNKIAANYGVKPYDVHDPKLDLSHVTSADKLIIQGHGNATAMTYPPEVVAAELSKRGLKRVGELICLGCFTGQGFAAKLATKLSVIHGIPVKGYEAPKNLMTPTSQGVPHTFTDEAQEQWDRLKLQREKALFGDEFAVFAIDRKLDQIRKDPASYEQIGTGGDAWAKGRPDLIDFG